MNFTDLAQTWMPTQFTLLWPRLVWLMAILPLFIVLYAWLLRRRGKRLAQYQHLQTVWQMASGAPAATGTQARNTWGWRIRNHLPAALMLLALAAFLFSLTRPQAAVMLPLRVDNVMLALDMSGSMRADDLKPNRLAAAQAAAKVFIEDQPPHTRMGVVAIAATAAVVQSPTTKREEVTEAIDRLAPQRGTALGSGLVIALASLLPNESIDVEKFIAQAANRPAPPGGQRPAERAEKGGSKDSAAKATREPEAPGSNSAAAIVLLSDGFSNIGPDPLKAARLAADFGVRVFTVGVGTPEGISLTVDGMTSKVRLDEDTLKKIAEITHGEYFRTDNAQDLKKIYRYLSARLTLDKKTPTEISSLFVALGAGLALLSAMLSMWWFNRIL